LDSQTLSVSTYRNNTQHLHIISIHEYIIYLFLATSPFGRFIAAPVLLCSWRIPASFIFHLHTQASPAQKSTNETSPARMLNSAARLHNCLVVIIFIPPTVVSSSAPQHSTATNHKSPSPPPETSLLDISAQQAKVHPDGPPAQLGLSATASQTVTRCGWRLAAKGCMQIVRLAPCCPTL
jgi:hypothetical protein